MKAISVLILMLLISVHIMSQVPQKMSYQSVIRNPNNQLIANKSVGIKISILSDNENGTVVFSEKHLVTTNGNGLACIIIGNGQTIEGSIVSIDWGSHNFYIKIETDPDGGENYTISGTSQLLSVPYALYANNGYWAPYGGPGIYKWLGNIGMGNYPTDFRLELTQSDTNKGLRILGGTNENSKLLSVSSYGTVEIDDHGVEGGRLMIKTGGNVGLGETNPTERLVVNGKTKTTNLQVTNGAASGKILTSDAAGNATWQNPIPQNPTYWSQNGDFVYTTQSCAIGTNAINNYDTYSKSLEIYNSNAWGSGSHIYLSSARIVNTYFPIGSISWTHHDVTATDKRFASIQSFTDNASTLANPKGNIKFFTNNGSGLFEAVGISAAGNMGIGNPNPTRPLSFPATLGEKILLYPGSVGEVGIGVYGNELRLHIDVPNGKVSFGSQDNSGVFTEFGKFEKNGVYALSVFGSIWANGVTYSSDERFKKNIGPISGALDKIKQLRGVEYELKPEFSNRNFSDKREMGLIAQEVEKVVPEAVSEIDGYKGVDYARLVPILIESLKEQQKQIEILQNKVNQLEKKK